MKDMDHIKGCRCIVCLPGGAVPPARTVPRARGARKNIRPVADTIIFDDLEMDAQVPPPNPPPAGDKEKPTPNPSQEGNKSEIRNPKSEIGRDYKNESQQNLIKIVEYLARDVFKPATTQEIMEALALTKSKAHWTLNNLKIGGWAEQVSSGWRLSPELVKIADSVRATLKEVMHRYL